MIFDDLTPCSTALLSEECLTILLKDVPHHLPLGKLLGIAETTLEAIGTYYNNNCELTVSHMIVMWLVHDPGSPMEKLCEALNATGEHEIATQLTLLSSLSKEEYM